MGNLNRRSPNTSEDFTRLKKLLRITNQEIKFKGECCKIKLDLETFKILKEDLIFILISICN